MSMICPRAVRRHTLAAQLANRHRMAPPGSMSCAGIEQDLLDHHFGHGVLALA
jgi:hypothetical protein